jgi:hypothetical protein
MPRPCTCEKDGCRLCHLYHKDERYKRLWDGTPAPRPVPTGKQFRGWPQSEIDAYHTRVIRPVKSPQVVVRKGRETSTHPKSIPCLDEFA